MSMAIASVHFAHVSRLFTIRTASQTQNAANATARVGRSMVIAISKRELFRR